jgi:molybdopterin-containing oxidoreductase family iron-sulfur binding subunit
VPRYRLDECDFLISFGVDFLETWVSPVEFTQQFSRMRAYKDGQVGQFIYAGPRMSMTAVNADRYLPMPPGAEGMLAMGMLHALIANGWTKADVTALKELVSDFTPAAVGKATGVAAEQIVDLARKFAVANASLALAGPAATTGEASLLAPLATALLNYAAGRIGQTVDFSQPHTLSSITPQKEVQRALEGLTPDDVLIVHNCDIAYSRPEALQHLRRAGLVVYLGTMMDETATLADWVLPIDSPLESWGDYEPYAGTRCFIQPTTARLWDSRLAGDVLIDLAKAAGREINHSAGQRETYAADFQAKLRQSVDVQQSWPALLRNPVLEAAPAKQEIRLSSSLAQLQLSGPATVKSAANDRAELWKYPSLFLFDGRLANRGWMQETPDPVSFAVWGSVLEIHPKKAAALDLANDDVVQLNAGIVRQRRNFELPVRINEWMDENTVAVALGQGHTALGRKAANVGINAFSLLGLDPDDISELGAKSPGLFGTVSLRKTGRKAPAIYASASQEQHERDLLQWVALSALRTMKHDQGEELRMPLPEGWDKHKDLYPSPPRTGHRWAMAVDLHKCVGCGACAVACSAENNIPVVGAGELAKGRELAWLQVPPYQSQHVPGRKGWLPMLCQHCDAAPCEPVCPVFASVHNEEGLNAQIYNRCIGTRYCNNNCPYKVRRFNWFDYPWEKPLDWQLNPEVTVRCRGVMEKCTFCIQRIREIEHRAKREKRAVRDGEIQPACQQTCPAGVFTFGDLLDEKSRVRQLIQNDPRRYQVLGELNTKPAVIYFKRIEVDV